MNAFRLTQDDFADDIRLMKDSKFPQSYVVGWITSEVAHGGSEALHNIRQMLIAYYSTELWKDRETGADSSSTERMLAQLEKRTL